MFRPRVELAALVRAGELSAVELVEASLRRIDALEPDDQRVHPRRARVGAGGGGGDRRRAIRRPFAGVPIAIKDNRPVAGMPITMCSDLFGDVVARHDAFLVRRLREAGFVIVGKTALPEMGILPTTESRRFGPTHNPWALDRTPGRLERRLGRRGRGRDGPDRPRQRRRRLDADPGRLLRPGRAQGRARPGLGRPRRRPELPGRSTAC